MKINKFNEKYKSDFENDISREYAKCILSEFIDKENNDATIEEVYYDFIKGDDLEQHQADMIKSQLMIFLQNTLKETKILRDIYKIEAEKNYNL
jgi:hypothetical protein